ncbi:MAG: HAMP domain-containing histidine kinase [Candidatus Omnitrophica bacterium]|nr:HAMP domain-containing histidine kinase [Candidatus Omnitrophota bacterium]
MKSDFVANVSHEIRSPMAPMKDSLSLLLDGTAGPLTEKQRRFLNILGNNMDRLIRLVNDLLDLSKIQAGEMEIKKSPVKLGRLTEEVVNSLHTYADRKRIELTCNIGQGLPEVNCDEDRISQVIINLLMNAVKFTPEGGKISVSAQMMPRNDYVEISVRDSGPGMSRGEADILFNRFKQLVTPQAVKGTGLGLSISKAIVEMHGGQICVESEKDKGSIFKFTLPVDSGQ